MQRESRSNYIVRKMQESRATSPEEQKIVDNRPVRARYEDQWAEDQLIEENRILKNNVKELQEQLQNAYKRINELSEESTQMELDV